MRAVFTNPLTKMSVKQQLILLFLLLVSPVFILHWYGNEKAERILTRHVTTAYAELNKQNHTLIGRDIDAVDRIAKTIIQHPVTQQLAKSRSGTVYERVRQYEAMDTLLGNYAQSSEGGGASYFSLFVYDPEDAFFFAADVPLAANAGAYFFSDDERPDWYDEALALKGKGFLKMIGNFWPKTGQPTLAYIRAVNNIDGGNEPIGVLVATNMEDKIGELLRTVSLPDGEIYLTDAEDRVLASTVPAAIATTLPLPEAMAAGRAPAGVTDRIEAGYIYVVDASADPGRKLVYRIPVDTLLEQQSELKRVIERISIVYSLFAFVVMVYLWRSLMTPLQKLASFVRSYEPSQLIPSTPGRGRKDEVGVLIQAVYDMARRLNELIHYRYLMEIRQKESQLRLLYQQINPHLLYNTLESIYWKSELEGRSESAEMIKELARLMKISLSRGRELITLREELEHAQAYCLLQQKRYELGYEVRWEIDEQALPCLVPKITLQPFIENAILHGVKHMGEDGLIVVSARIRQDRLMLRVEDNGYKAVDYAAIGRLLHEEQADPSLGYGIRNVHQRIRLHYGGEYGVSYEPRAGGGTVVTIVLPARAEEEPAERKGE